MFDFRVSKAAGSAVLLVDGGLYYSINFDSRGRVYLIIQDGWIVSEEVIFY